MSMLQRNRARRPSRDNSQANTSPRHSLKASNPTTAKSHLAKPISRSTNSAQHHHHVKVAWPKCPNRPWPTWCRVRRAQVVKIAHRQAPANARLVFSLGDAACDGRSGDCTRSTQFCESISAVWRWDFQRAFLRSFKSDCLTSKTSAHI
jgi:hypothetical protein